MVAGLASTTTSRISSAMTGSFLSFGRFGQVLQAPQAFRPVLVEEPTEPVHLEVVGPVEAAGAVSSFDDQLALTQDAKVLRDGRSGDVAEPGGDLGGRQLLGPHPPEDLPPPGLGQCLERGVHGSYISTYLRKCQLTYSQRARV